MANSEDNTRNVADYFVVAGLPKENPQLLDEYSLEVNLKPSAYQDPITDITVIVPSLGENVPDYYQLIDQTPGGHSADLNSGSFRAPEVFVCYRRGRDRPPLLDIGVLYDGKERLTPDSQVVEFTPNGHSANVNNTHNSAVYLTYKRATEVSPPNEKVVMDLCVIVTTKGDDVPHGFKVIAKTLNKGMVGSEVFLCFKKSMNRPDLISYKPGLVKRLPLKNNPNYSLEDNVALFCMPLGATLECWPSNSSRPAAVESTFVLTLATREKVYGTAITFYEDFDEESLTDEQKDMLQLKKWTRKSDRKILANKCICLLSRWPFFEAFKNFLFFLHKRQLMGPFDIPLERWISHFLYDVPFPSPERPRILVQLSPEEKIALFQPEELPLPRSGASFRHFLANLGPENCLTVLLLALTEQTILIHSFRPDVLTSVAEAVMQIIFPFYWQCPYIPLCPIWMSNYLAAPLPVVIGLDSRFFDLYDKPDEVNAIDLDANTITLASSLKDFSSHLLPKRPAKKLRNTLERLREKLAEQIKKARELEAHNDETIDFEFKMKKPAMLLEMEIREAFLVFMVDILSGYKSYLQPINANPSTTVGVTDVANLFNQSGFLTSRDKKFHQFYKMLMQTQMFTKFIEERSFVGETNTALAFFDECVDHAQDRYLDIEFPDSDRTVFIMPPDASGLTPSDQEYKYETFEDLNPDLFEDKSEILNQIDKENNETDNQNNIFATPVSTVAKRTKQEIKSAKKSARKLIDNKFFWAKYLVNTTYSVWFIHLPAFTKFNKALKDKETKALRLGITILQRMRRLTLNPIEEICFRVMMQLCGAYHQPRFAMNVLNEMTLMGMTPNAVTYGHYNKAVLESVWAEPKEASKAVKMWQKISIVLDVIHRFRVCGSEAQTVNSFSRERQLQQQRQQNGTSKTASQSESDNVSRSSQESGLSRLSKDQQSSQQQPLTSRAIEESNCDSGRVSSSETSEEVKSENAVNPNNEIEILEDKIDHVEITDTPTTGTKNITRYGDIRERHTNLFAGGGPPPPPPTSSVNRVLFTSGSASDDLDDNCDGIKPIKSGNSSSKSNQLDQSEEEIIVVEEKELLATVSENDDDDGGKLSPSGGASLKPPNEPGLKKVVSAAKMELTGVPVEENDPLGALSNSTSPTSSMPKSATANNLQNNHVINTKRPSLQEENTNLFGLQMSKSSTLPSPNDPKNNRAGYLSNFKSKIQIGNIKAAASSWVSSPAFKESMNKGTSSLRTQMSVATTAISKRVEEFREQTPSKMQGASSNPNLASCREEDSLSVSSTDGVRRPSEIPNVPYDQDTWSNFTGQAWDQFMSYVYQPQASANSSQPPQSPKTFSDIFEEHYASMPKEIPGAKAMEIIMTSCSKCKNCASLLYDEEIIGGWSAEDNNLNTRCPFCSQCMVPFLTVHVLDHRHDGESPRISEAITIPYLSPLVLRRELESIIEKEGDACLGDDNCVDDHPHVYWNLVWYFQRIGVNSYLPGLVLRSRSLNAKTPIQDPMWSEVDHRNVSIKIMWDNQKFNEDLGVPLYLQHRSNKNSAGKAPTGDSVKNFKASLTIKAICDGVQNRDLFMALKNLLDERSECENDLTKKRSTYREMLFVTLESFGQDNIDLVAFDREYRRAWEKLPNKYTQSLTKPEDRPPTSFITLCRKFYRELKI